MNIINMNEKDSKKNETIDIDVEINNIEENKIAEQDTKQKRIASIAIMLVAVVLLILSAVYIADRNFRNVIDEKILGKSVTQEKLPTIEINKENIPNIYLVGNTITTLENGELKKYNSNGKLEKKIDIDINNPIYATRNNYLMIAEKNDKKLFLVENDTILWQKELEGNISKISINRNGYSVIALTGTTYKTVILVLDNEGKELLKTYLSQTIAIDVAITDDNKYMSFAEINTSGTLIQTTVKTLEIEKVKDSPSEAIINTYQSDIDQLVIDIKYTDKGKLICKYDDTICMLENGEKKELQKIKDDKKINGASINLSNHVARVLETSTGTFDSDTTLEIINTINKKESVYITEGVLKDMYTYQNIISLNFGTEIHFIDINGWLMKRYTSTEEISDVKIGNNIAAVVYRDRIEIINL